MTSLNLRRGLLRGYGLYVTDRRLIGVKMGMKRLFTFAPGLGVIISGITREEG